MKILERLARDVAKDSYFNQLFNEVNAMFFKKVFREKQDPITEKKLTDIMRFCDILSNSTITEHRNLSYKIITLLNPFFQENQAFQIVANAVLSKLGNFPALQLLNYNVSLPFDRKLETKVKRIVQRTKTFDNIYLTDTQFALYQKMINSNVFSFSGPTSMGKSFMIKLKISELMDKKARPNIAVIVPTRALIHQFATEIKNDLRKQINEKDYTVLTNGNLEGLDIENSKLILVLTPERLLSYLSEYTYPRINCLFVDEAHKLANEQDKRSVTLYTAIERAIFSNKYIELFFASPNVSNPDIFLKLFNKETKYVYQSSESPVAQQLFYIDLIERCVIHYTETKDIKYKPTILKEQTDCLKIINYLSKDHANLVYCPSKREAVTRAQEYSERFPAENMNIEAKRRIQEAIRIIESVVHPDYYLIDCLKKGVAYHFSNLPQVVRNNIEKLFKDGVIKFLFCTSTLLEGVNLPAKNVFILKNKNGNRNFKKVDFWNLAGRAGRLKYELSGNIFCIRNEVRDWKDPSKFLKDKENITLNPTVSKNLDNNISDIENAISNKELDKLKATEKDIVKYLANIISINTLDLAEGYQSPIIEKLIEKDQSSLIEKAKEKVQFIQIPKKILKINQFLPVEQQESAYQYVLESKLNKNNVTFPSVIDYDHCLYVLKLFHKIYKWDTYEKKNLGNLKSLSYYAVIMNQWINGMSLNECINRSIFFHQEKKRQIYVYRNKKNQLEFFDSKNRSHVNILINNLVEDIESILRFSIQTYVSHYYLILQDIYGEEKAGVNWSNFLEYGTRNPIVIALQNMGLSRYVSNYLIKNYKPLFNIEHGILKVDKEVLLGKLEFGSIEQQEVQMFL
ncbi:DEAD/DEAH box helicase [Bacillus subtilis]|uniref:DEAD/DEAH box helicase n=1 Tax=Bacillus subtilis TaxID=1423 RepID=UPI001368B608|nr:DEAD/DEAH box helicase [Bacillus subtilis]MXV42888.1 DEAD/DEAH box helicase [Bacillus subtilis]